MHHLNKYIDVEDRSADLDNIYKEIEKLELGLRAVCVMYNDHSNDVNSRKNIFRLKDNIYYRLTSARHQYRLLLEELFRSEKYLERLVKNNPNALNGFLFNNPHFQKLEADISSVFDGLIFHIASIFDYFSHIVCYICQKDENDTLYWTKLAKAARGHGSEISKLQIAKTIDEVDRNFVRQLYDYRSRLIHYNRDQHLFTASQNLHHAKFDIKLFASKHVLRYSKQMTKEYSHAQEFTLPFLASWQIRAVSKQIGYILQSLVVEIKTVSKFDNNIQMGKGDNWFTTAAFDPVSKTSTLTSDILWEQYLQSLKQ